MTFFRCGGAGIPGALKTGMNNVLNKKFGTIGQNYDPNGWPDDVNLLGALEVKTASGGIASFSDGADDVPISSGVFDIDYDANGHNGMTITRTGKNLFNKAVPNVVSGYIDTVSFNTGNQNAKTVYLPIKGGETYTVSKTAGLRFSIATSENIPSSNEVYTSRKAKNTASSLYITAGANDKYLWAWIFLDGTDTGTLEDMLASIQIEVGSTSTQYTNFVEIDNYPVSWIGLATVYGGFYDSVTGILTSTKASDGSDLAEPIETNIGQTAVNSILGYNNIYCDTGDCSIDYRSSGIETFVQPILITKQIMQNGTYNAASDDADGYSSITVSVSGGGSFTPTFSETLICDNSSHNSSFTLSEAYTNYDLVKIVWYESASSSGFLYTTPDILDEIFTVSTRLCINKTGTNLYACYSKNGLTWTRTNMRTLQIHAIYGVTFTNCSMTVADVYKRGAVTTTAATITSQISLKDYDMFMMSSIHATEGSETMPLSWVFQYPSEIQTAFFSPFVLEEYNGNNELFTISEYEMSAARYFMVQGIKFTQS